jgi:hypothetical protein
MMMESSSRYAGSKLTRPSWLIPISCAPMDWCAPPSGASVTPEGVPGDDEAGVLVTGIVQRIEAAGDERIIDRADRDQPLAEQGMRQARRTQQ